MGTRIKNLPPGSPISVDVFPFDSIAANQTRKVTLAELQGALGGSFSVPNEATLSAQDVTAMPDGTLAHVSSHDSLWRLVTGFAAITAHLRIASPVVGRRWERVVVPSFKFQDQISWVVDTLSGDDQNGGQSPLFALRSTDELLRRVAANGVWFNVSGTLLTVGLVGLQNIPAMVVATPTVLTFLGTPNFPPDNSWSAVVPANPATNTLMLATSTAPHGLSYGDLVRLTTSGPDVVAVVAEVVDPSNVRLTDAYDVGSLAPAVNPVATDLFSGPVDVPTIAVRGIENLRNRVRFIWCAVTMGGNSNTNVTHGVDFYGCKLNGTNHRGAATFAGCLLAGVQHFDAELSVVSSSVVSDSCQIWGGEVEYRGSWLADPVSRSSLTVHQGGKATFFASCPVQLIPAATAVTVLPGGRVRLTDPISLYGGDGGVLTGGVLLDLGRDATVEVFPGAVNYLPAGNEIFSSFGGQQWFPPLTGGAAVPASAAINLFATLDAAPFLDNASHVTNGSRFLSM